MQVLVQVICSRGPSLREKIAGDARLDQHLLIVTKEKTRGRSKGWMKVRGTGADRRGTINVEWDGRTHVLLCRVVNRNNTRPDRLIGDFVAYLLARHRKRIQSIDITPR